MTGAMIAGAAVVLAVAGLGVALATAIKIGGDWKLKATVAALAVERAEEKANRAIQEQQERTARLESEIDYLEERVAEYRSHYLEALPDTPEGRREAGDHLDRQLDRVRELLGEMQEAGRGADPGDGPELRRRPDGSGDQAAGADV